MRASASLPTVSRIVEIDGHRYLDGGTTDSIPFETALGLEDGARVEGHCPAIARSWCLREIAPTAAMLAARLLR